MSDETVSEADCVLCRHLGPGEQTAMRAELLEIPVCDQCMEAFSANLFASFPKTEEEKLRRRAELAAGERPDEKRRRRRSTGWRLAE
jgi:hypothetical protein